MSERLDYDALPAAELLRAARNAGITFDADRFGRPAVRCPWPAPWPVPAIYDACVRRLAELNASLQTADGTR